MIEATAIGSLKNPSIAFKRCGVFDGYAKGAHPDLFPHNYTPHSFRHSIATHMLESGVPLPAIKAFLGHASINTTMIYTSTSQELVAKYLTEMNPYARQADMVEDLEFSYSAPAFLL